MASDLTPRSVARIVPGVRTFEGAGFPVRRPFPTPELSDFDPFLLLDEMGPVDYAPGAAMGAPDHPHRGFETVTYVLEGRMEHRDSKGNAGSLGPGDVQWMTAGRGVVHSEMPAAELNERGGRMHGFQLWVNLPRREKMMEPRYQEIPAARIPTASTADGRVTARVIAGEALGRKAVIATRTPIFYLHFTLAPGASLIQPAPADHNTFAWVVRGDGLFGSEGRKAGEGDMVLFASDGDAAAVSASDRLPLDVLVIGGVPLREPIARYGPFVMNTKAEIVQAVEDFQNGRFGN
ncbi:MAG TPA: pirin family protein [Thermoanaerobaculia bacterium]|nr:pirin family protein [Thermoanaerobaculia bacterium]